jgi:putative membrane protein
MRQPAGVRFELNFLAYFAALRRWGRRYGEILPELHRFPALLPQCTPITGGSNMNPLKPLAMLAVAAFALCAVTAIQAANETDSISTEDFVEEASAKGVAEIETAKLALEKSGNEKVKGFAQMMIDDHRRANQELAELAKRKDLDVSDDAELINQAKAMVLKLRGEGSFDKAYMNNQVVAHRQTIELFRRGVNVKDEEIAAFARETLPKLEQHLQRAEQINGELPEN